MQIDQILAPLYRVDRTRDFNQITETLLQMLKKNANLTLPQVERALRRNHCHTHLIARRRNSSHGNNIEFRKVSGVAARYFLFISTHPRVMAEIQTLKESSSFEENLEKLKDTGWQRSSNPLMAFRSGSTILTRDQALQAIAEDDLPSELRAKLQRMVDLGYTKIKVDHKCKLGV